MKRSTRQTAALFLALTPVLAQYSDPVPLIEVGQMLPGLGTVTGLGPALGVDQTGGWTCTVETTGGSALIHDGIPITRLTTEFSFAQLDGFGSVLHAGSTPADPVIRLRLDGVPILPSGDPVLGPAISPGAAFRGLELHGVNRAREVLVSSIVDQRRSLLRVAFATSPPSSTILFREGDLLTGLNVVANPLLLGPVLDDSGNALFSVFRLCVTRPLALYRNADLLLRVGDPAPITGLAWEVLGPHALGPSGDWVQAGAASSSSSFVRLLARGAEVFVQEGDSLPDIAPHGVGIEGPFTIMHGSPCSQPHGFHPLHVSDTGDVSWLGRWGDPAIEFGLFHEKRLVVQHGVTRVGGVTVDTIGSPYPAVDTGPVHALSRDGRYVGFQSTLSDGTRGFYRLDLGLGSSYCASLPNSTGQAAMISAVGSTSVAHDHVRLSARGLPAGATGLFAHGTLPAQVPFGVGFRCIAGSTVRLPAGIANATGVLSTGFAIESAALITPGSTAYFQAWYRDPVTHSVQTSNGLEITFTQ